MSQFDPFEPHRILQHFVDAIDRYTTAESLDGVIDALDRLVRDRGDAAVIRLEEIRPQFITAAVRVGYSAADADAVYKKLQDLVVEIRGEFLRGLVPIGHPQFEQKARSLVSVPDEVDWKVAAWESNQPIRGKIFARAVELQNDLNRIAVLIGAAETRQNEGSKPDADADPFVKLRDFARGKLKGQERAVVEALCDVGGELPIVDLAVKDGIDWGDEAEGFKNVQRRLKSKLKRIGWTISRQNNAARLRRTGVERGSN